MRIAIPVSNKDGLNSMVAQHFGRCPYFAMVDLVDNQVHSVHLIDNPFVSGHQVGEVPDFIKDQDAEVMVSGGMWGRAIQIFKQYGIEVATGADGTVQSTLARYLSGDLTGTAPCAESVNHGHGE